MSDTQTQANAADPVVDAPPDEGGAKRRRALRGRRDLWQVPVLLGACALLALGLTLWVRSAPGHDFDAALDSARDLVERQEYDRAIALLNGPIRESIGEPDVPPDTLARFYLLRADTLYLLQRQEGLDVAANNLRIVENYQAARAHADATLEPEQVARLAHTLISLNRVDDGLREVDRIASTAPALRHGVLKRVIERGLRPDASARQRSRATDLLAQLRADPESDEETRLWAVIRLTRLSLQAGNPEDAIRRLLPEMQRLDSRLDADAAELFALLGQAYLDLGLPDEARTHLTHAESIAEQTSETAARTQVSLAHLDRQAQDLERARDRFALVVERFPQSAVAPLALLGLGEIEADLGHVERSLNAYARLVDAVVSGMRSVVGIADADRSMEQRFREQYERGNYETALKYAELIHDLYRGADPPPPVILRLAETHRRLGEELMGELEHNADGTVDVDRADPATFERARLHFARAGDLFRRHARASVLGDPERSAESLWLAADSLDHAGDLEGAAELFSEYVEIRHDDPRQVEGEYRLARTFHARGEYEAASKIYEELLASHPTSDEAYASYVPLAQCYLYDPAAEDPERAEELLLHVISGEIFRPGAPEFRSALLELGRLYMRVGRHAEAIRRLTEARERYPDLEEDPRFQFRLADAHRLAAGAIQDDLRGAMPQSRRSRLESLLEQHLASSLDLYEEVVQRYNRSQQQEGRPRLADLDRVLLRNALFYRGDCAFDLGEHLSGAGDDERARTYFERAIRSYDTAAQRYADDPASLVAMIQIVNCYAALGKWREVQTAHERARTRLSELPPQAWERSDSPMDRRYWERWLEASVELDRLRRRADG